MQAILPRFLLQPIHVAEVFTGIPGRYVALKDTIHIDIVSAEGKVHTGDATR